MAIAKRGNSPSPWFLYVMHTRKAVPPSPHFFFCVVSNPGFGVDLHNKQASNHLDKPQLSKHTLCQFCSLIIHLQTFAEQGSAADIE